MYLQVHIARTCMYVSKPSSHVSHEKKCFVGPESHVSLLTVVCTLNNRRKKETHKSLITTGPIPMSTFGIGTRHAHIHLHV